MNTPEESAVPFRVLLISQHMAPEPTGNAPYADGLARWLGANARASQVLTTFPHYPDWKIWDGYGGWRSEEPFGSDSRIVRLLHYVPANPSYLRRLLSELSFGLRAVLARWHRPDVIVVLSPGLLSSVLALGKAKLLRKPCVVWIQDLYSVGLAERPGRLARIAGSVFKSLERFICTASNGVIVIHERFADILVREFEASSADVRVVRNWTHVQVDEGPQELERAAVREALGWQPGEIIAVHAGNQGEKQGLDQIVEIARLLDGTGSRIKWVMLGRGNQNAALRESGRGLSNLEFVDPLPEPEFMDALRAADVLVVCERPESAEAAVPSKLTTYFASGTPVVGLLNPAGITAQELEETAAGVFVDSSTSTQQKAEDLSGVIERAYSDLGLKAELSSAGFTFVHEELNEARQLGRLWAAVSEFASRE